tara:strand:+ start:117 stop:284 length:168 start_codon:yes stop_codon:yes gene_type:complete
MKTNDIEITKNKLEENEYFIFPMSKDTVNGLVKINVRPIIKSNNCIMNVAILYII